MRVQNQSLQTSIWELQQIWKDSKFKWIKTVFLGFVIGQAVELSLSPSSSPCKSSANHFWRLFQKTIEDFECKINSPALCQLGSASAQLELVGQARPTTERCSYLLAWGYKCSLKSFIGVMIGPAFFSGKHLIQIIQFMVIKVQEFGGFFHALALWFSVLNKFT